MPRDTLGQLWTAIERAGDWDQLFWWQVDEGQTPWPIKGDLVDVISFFQDSEDPKVLLIGEHEGQLVGCTWFNLFKPDGQCEGGVWVDPKWRGIFSRQLVLQSLAYMQANHGIRKVNATTLNPVCRNLCRKCGFKDEPTDWLLDRRVLYNLSKELSNG